MMAAVAGAALGVLLALALDRGRGPVGGESRHHVINLVARRYAFDPPVIRVERGDEVRLRFASLDVVHGVYLEGYDIDVTIEPLRREVQVRRGNKPPETMREVVFKAERGGKFRYRCSKTCGVMHPFMVGELIVGPNWLLRVSSLAAVSLLVGGSARVWHRTGREEAA
jgi:heme/copper-type cytochrome/quinol oxidase subunit 2